MSDWDSPTITIGSKARKPVVAKKESDVNGQSGLHRWQSPACGNIQTDVHVIGIYAL